MAKKNHNPIYGLPVGGMGDINEYDFRYPQVRSPMPQRPDDKIWEQQRHAPIPPEFCWVRGFVEEMKCQMNGMLREILATTAIPAVPPPYMTPSFYAQPQLRHNILSAVAVSPATFVTVVTFRIPTNSRLVLTSLGVDSESDAALNNLMWRFFYGGRISPIIVDEALVGPANGCFTFRVGTINDPFSFRDHGLAPHYDGGGNTLLQLQVRNTDAVATHVAEAVVGAYVYPLPQSSQEKGGDVKAT